MKTHVPNLSHLTLLTRINQHDRSAGSLGILPNHLIQLIRLTNKNNLHQILNDLRFTTFWATYNIWKKRQSLNRTFWNIAPVFFQDKSDSKKKKKGKGKRKIKKSFWDDCKNPFHHLVLKDSAKSIQGTCDCSRVIHHEQIKEKKIIRATSLFGQSRNHTQPDDSGLDYNHATHNTTRHQTSDIFCM